MWDRWYSTARSFYSLPVLPSPAVGGVGGRTLFTSFKTFLPHPIHITKKSSQCWIFCEWDKFFNPESLEWKHTNDFATVLVYEYIDEDIPRIGVRKSYGINHLVS
jgi:hypothetical protein